MKRRPKKLPYIPPPDELEAIIKATATERDRLLMMVMFYMGLRVAEACKLEVPHLDWKRKLLEVREGKGCKDRILPIPAWLVGPLRGLVGGRKSGPVFLSRRRGRLGVRVVQLLMKKLATRAGLHGAGDDRKYTPHKLRHGFATEKMRRKVHPRIIQKMLGHSSLGTTMVYLDVMPEDLREGMEA